MEAVARERMLLMLLWTSVRPYFLAHLDCALNHS